VTATEDTIRTDAELPDQLREALLGMIAAYRAVEGGRAGAGGVVRGGQRPARVRRRRWRR
jgi:hypothetical protein